MPSIASDIPLSGIAPFQVAPKRNEFPFAKNGDYVSYIVTRALKQAAASFAQGNRGVDTDAAYPGGDSLNYLCDETAPVPDEFGGLVRFDRSYARIPANQVTYPGSRYITKPDYVAPEAFNPLTLGGSSEGAVTRFSDWSAIGGNATYTPVNGIATDGDSKVYFPVKVPSAQAVGYATAGTFTLTYGASTTSALAYNAPESTIQSAINGLASIIAASITVTVTFNSLNNTTTGGGISMTLAGGTDAARLIPITMNAGSLTVSTSAHPATSVITVNTQQIKLPTHLTATAHGLSASLDLAVVWGFPTTFILPVGYWGVIDANTIWIAPYGNNAYAAIYVATYSYTYSGGTALTYTAGIRLVRTRVTEKYYLPGVSSGIVTPSDIPVPADLQNPATFLTALLTPLTGWQVYESSGPAFWMNGPIYVVFITEVNFADLI